MCGYEWKLAKFVKKWYLCRIFGMRKCLQKKSNSREHKLLDFYWFLRNLCRMVGEDEMSGEEVLLSALAAAQVASERIRLGVQRLVKQEHRVIVVNDATVFAFLKVYNFSFIHSWSVGKVLRMMGRCAQEGETYIWAPTQLQRFSLLKFWFSKAYVIVDRARVSVGVILIHF